MIRKKRHSNIFLGIIIILHSNQTKFSISEPQEPKPLYTLVSYKLYYVGEDQFADTLTETDDDLTDEPSENDIYHDHDYDSQTNHREVIRIKIGYISDAISTGR